MRLRYQIGADKKARFETLNEAVAVAAYRYSRGSAPPEFVIDRATRQQIGAADLARACDILAGKQVGPGTIPTFIDADGDVHMGIRA